MSSASLHQQYPSSIDMTMLDRVLKKVCAEHSIASNRTDEQRVAAPLIRQFQHGVNKEADLMTAFTGHDNFKPRVPLSKLSRSMGDALDRWKTIAAHPRSIPEKGFDPMRYLDRLPTEPAVWLLTLMLVAVVGAFLYMVLSNITY